MEKVITYEFNGRQATVIVPEKPNGKWIWKTEFLYAFDNAEVELLKMGYIRVYYNLNDMYGDYRAVRMMHNFYLHIIDKFNLDKKCILFGFSRGGLYAFNYTLSYPDTVDKVYLDAPVLDLTTWPKKAKEGTEMRRCYDQMIERYNFIDQTVKTFIDMPINNLSEFFAHKIPLLIVAGDSDDVVDFTLNSKKIIDYCKTNNLPLKYIVKKGCKHHPHSLEDVEPILDFVCGRGE